MSTSTGLPVTVSAKVLFRGPTRTNYAIRNGYYFGWILCLVLVQQYIWKVDYNYKIIAGLLVTVLGFVMMFKKPIYALCLLPIVSLIGPIVSWDLLPSVSLNLGDIFLGALLIGYLLSKQFSVAPWTGPYPYLAYLLILLVIISWLLSIDKMSSAVAIVGIIQLIMVYLLTINVVKKHEDMKELIYASIAAVSVCGYLVFSSYLSGEPLLLGVDEQYIQNYASLRLINPDAFSAATFFVTGFNFPLAIITVTVFLYILNPTGLSKLQRLICFISLPICVATLMVMNNKTSIFAAAIVCLIVLFNQNYSKRALSKIINIVMGFAVLASCGFLALYLISPDLIDGLQSRLQSRFSDSETFFIRVSVWSNVVQFLLDYPITLFFGIGPDISVRKATDELVMNLFTGSNGTEGAVDSGYLYVLLNYGIFLLGLMVFIFISTMSKLWKSMKTIDQDSYKLTVSIVWSVILCWMIMGVTQQHGVSKPVFFIMQFMALAHLIITNRIQLSVAR